MERRRQRQMCIRDSPEWARTALDGTDPDAAPAHPLFAVVPGDVAEWERIKP